MSLFARAQMNVNLTPSERALLRFIQGTLLSAVVAGLQAGLPLLNDAALAAPASIQWGSVLHTFVAAFVLTCGMAVRKYFAAQADPALPGNPVVLAPDPMPTPAVPTPAAASTGDPALPPGVPLASIQAQLAPTV